MRVEELVEVAAVALFTKHYQRAPSAKDYETNSMHAYQTIAYDVVEALAKEGALNASFYSARGQAR